MRYHKNLFFKKLLKEMNYNLIPIDINLSLLYKLKKIKTKYKLYSNISLISTTPKKLFPFP